MKKYFLLLFVLPLAFGACKNNDNNDDPLPITNILIGSWHLTSYDGTLLDGSMESLFDEENNETADMIVKADGTFVIYDYYNGDLVEIASGTYKLLSSSKVTLSIDGYGITATAEIVTLNATTLTLRLEEFDDPGINEFFGESYSAITCSFTKTDDSVVFEPTWNISATSADHVTATLSEDGKTLTISGTGAMKDYDYSSGYYEDPPWSNLLSSITSLIIEQGVTNISNKIFYDGNFISVSIPNSVTSIGNEAFRYCFDLTSIIIPSEVTSIGYSAFDACDGLTSITSLNPIPSSISMGSDVFYGVNKSACVLYVPANAVSLYKVAPQWRDFSIIMSI